MAITNPDFELGDGVPTGWTLTTTGANTYADFSTFGGGIESFYWGWPGEADVSDWTGITGVPAEFDSAVHAYETWALTWIDTWAHASGLAGYFNGATEVFDSFEWTTWYTTVPTPVTAIFGGVDAFESFEGIWWVALPAPAAATFDNKWGGGGAPVAFENFEP